MAITYIIYSFIPVRLDQLLSTVFIFLCLISFVIFKSSEPEQRVSAAGFGNKVLSLRGREGKQGGRKKDDLIFMVSCNTHTFPMRSIVKVTHSTLGKQT